MLAAARALLLAVAVVAPATAAEVRVAPGGLDAATCCGSLRVGMPARCTSTGP